MLDESPVSHLLSRISRFFSSPDEALPINSPIPTVTLPDESGNPVNLAATSSGWLLVYFYPRADTPGCTRQACSLRDSYAELLDHGVQVFGVSLDSVSRQKRFRDKYHLPFPLLADTDGRLAKAFGVPTSFGFSRRQAFLFRAGRLVWRDLAAATDQQAADVMEALRKYNDGSH